jgi:hypothetical protein
MLYILCHSRINGVSTDASPVEIGSGLRAPGVHKHTKNIHHTVCLFCGGIFLDIYLLEELVERDQRSGLEALSEVPLETGGVGLGQIGVGVRSCAQSDQVEQRPL